MTLRDRLALVRLALLRGRFRKRAPRVTQGQRPGPMTLRTPCTVRTFPQRAVLTETHLGGAVAVPASSRTFRLVVIALLEVILATALYLLLAGCAGAR